MRWWRGWTWLLMRCPACGSWANAQERLDGTWHCFHCWHGWTPKERDRRKRVRVCNDCQEERGDDR